MVCRNVGPLTIFLLIGCFVTSGLTEYKKSRPFLAERTAGVSCFMLYSMN